MSRRGAERVKKVAQQQETAQGETLTANDAYQNVVAGFGVGADNQAEGADYPLTRLTQQYMLIISLYRSSGIIRRIVNKPVQDACAHWFKVDSQISPDHIDMLDTLQRKAKLKKAVETGLKWARLFGGAAGLIMIDGQGDQLDQPLDLATVEMGSFKGLYIIDRWSGIYPESGIVDDINSPSYGLPEYYQVRTDEQSAAYVRVHYSRIVRFPGEDVPYWETMFEQYWGTSVIESCFDELKMYDNTRWNIASLIFQANVWIQKSEDLDEMLAMGTREQQDRLWSTIHAQQSLMSSTHTRVIGKDDEISSHQYTFSGLDKVFEIFMYALSSVSGIPITILFGRSAAGLDATGDGDLENYYTMIEDIQENKIRPVIEQILPIICMSEFGAVPDDIDIRFNPVRVPNPSETADLVQKKASTVNELFVSGLLPRSAALKELKSMADETGAFSNITDEDIDEAENEPDIGDMPPLDSPSEESPDSESKGPTMDSMFTTDANRWITIGGGENEYGEGKGRHVEIDENGNIVAGAVPKSAQGKSIRSWWKSQKTATTTKEQNSNEQASSTSNNSRIEKLIEKYGIKPIRVGSNAGKVIVSIAPKSREELSDLESKISEIKTYFSEKLAEEETEKARRKTNIANIPGLKEIESLLDQNERWYEAFNRSFEKESGGMETGKRPKGNVSELLKKYPQAAAYLRIKSESEKRNYELADIGQKALNRFEDDPSKWREITADMDKEVKGFTNKHLWD